MPDDFGLLGMVLVILAIGRILSDGGMTTSIMRKKNPDLQDYQTVFGLNIVLSLTFYLLIFFAAPYIAEFYQRMELMEIVRLMALTILINACSAMQKTKLIKLMKFKILSVIILASTFSGGLLGVVLALNGYGVYSLVYMYIAIAGLQSTLIWLVSKDLLLPRINKFRTKEHLNFGINLSASALLNTVFDNLYYIIIGRYFSAASLGYYTRADTYRMTPITIISAAVNQVAMPILANLQDNTEALKAKYRSLQIQIMLIITPLMLGAAAIARPMFHVLFTDKWDQAIPYFQLLCLAGVLYPLHAYNLMILNIKGRSDLFLKVEIIKKILIISAIFLSFPFGIIGLIVGQLILSVLALAINAYYSAKFIQYGLLEQLRDITFPILVAMFMGSIVHVQLSFFPMPTELIQVLMSLALGSLFYLFMLRITKFEEFMSLLRALRKSFK